MHCPICLLPLVEVEAKAIHSRRWKCESCRAVLVRHQLLPLSGTLVSVHPEREPGEAARALELLERVIADDGAIELTPDERAILAKAVEECR